MAIPKIIHYCWFGKGEMGNLEKECLESWHKYCPEYEFMLWNEENFDIDCLPYVREAYDARKFAFVSDYARLYALHQIGGFYMDTDVELLKPLDDYCKYKAVIGTESIDCFGTGFVGAERSSHIILQIMETYKNKHFINTDGSMNMTPNPVVFTELLNEVYGLAPSLRVNDTHPDIATFPFEYFCCFSLELQCVCTNKNSVAIHHYNGSWLNDNSLAKLSCKKKLKRFALNIFGYSTLARITLFVRKLRGGTHK